LGGPIGWFSFAVSWNFRLVFIGYYYLSLRTTVVAGMIHKLQHR
jgi:hypothetical protein